MDSFKRFSEHELPDKIKFFVHLKTVKLMKKNMKELLMFGNYFFKKIRSIS